VSEAISSRTEASQGHPQRWWVLAAMTTSLVLVVASVSSLNLAIPTIRDALATSNTELLWVLDSYGLVFAGLLLPAGALGDRYGRKEALIVGLILFIAGATAAAVAGNAAMLIASRSVMGVGAALIMPATLSIITVVFPPSERAKAIAIWVGFAGAGGALGLLAGGVLLDFFWWGSVFFINIPIAIVVLVAVLKIVPTSRDEEQRPIDIAGSLYSIGALGILLYGVIEGPERGWTDTYVLTLFVMAAVLSVLFVRRELKSRAPLLDPKYFLNRRFTLGSLAITTSFLAMFGFFFLITLLLQFGQGHSPIAAAVRTLPFAGTMVVVAPRSAGLAERFGPRMVITGGLMTVAAGLVGVSFLAVTSPYWHLLIWFIVLAAGLAVLMPPATEGIVSSVPQSKAGVGSAVNDTTREVGGALGIALMGSLVSVGYRSGIGGALVGLPAEAADAARDSIGGALGVAAEIGGQRGADLIEAAGSAFADGIGIAFLVAAGLMVVTAALVAVFHPRFEASVPGRDLSAASGVASSVAEAPASTD